MKIYEAVSLTVLFLVGIALWTLPIQQDQLPFGEGDAAWHFSNGDWATKTDHVYWKLPFYISTWYYEYNKIIGVGSLEYPPPYHVGYSIFQIIGGGRFVPVYILIAMSSFIGAFSVYLLLRKLYDFPTAILASSAMVFSFREILVYLWGQRPTIFSFAFVPLVLYFLFRYLDSIYKENHKSIYLYLTSGMLIFQFLIHPQGLMLSLTSIIIYGIVQTIRKKKLPVGKFNLLHLAIILGISLLVIVPFFDIYRGANAGVETKIKIQDIHRLLDWMEIEDRQGYPNEMGGPPVIFYNTDKVYFPFYYILVVVGIIYLLLRREDQDILILSWLAGLYILLHFDVIGVFSFGRLSRMLMGETALFYSLISIGIVGGIKMFTEENLQKKIIPIAVILLLIGVVSYNGLNAYQNLNDAYKYPLRISNEQYEAAQWMDQNLPQSAYVYYAGVLTYPKQRFFYILSHRPGIWQNDRADYPWMNVTHIVIDYSDAVKTNNGNLKGALTNYEQQFISAGVPLEYNHNNIKIYSIKGGKIAG